MKNLLLFSLFATACSVSSEHEYLYQQEGHPPIDEANAITAVLNFYDVAIEPHNLTLNDVYVGWIHADTIEHHPTHGGVTFGCDSWIKTGDHVGVARYLLAHEIFHCYLATTFGDGDPTHQSPLWSYVEKATNELHEQDLLHWDPDIY